MDLHRIEGQAEWTYVAPENRTVWQKVAARTGGIITISNFFSLLGLLSVPCALLLIFRLEEYILGAILLLLGRGFDVADGWLADKTGTKSPLGEKTDATFDKVSTILAVVVLTATSIMPVAVLIVLLVPHIIVAVMALVVWKRGKILHPSLAGKLGMVPAWLCLSAFVVLAGVSGDIKQFVAIAAYGLVAISVIVSSYAVRGYIKEFKQAGP